MLRSNLGLVWDLIHVLGLIPNLEKSELEPSQDFCYVGMNFLTDKGLVRVPRDRIRSILAQVFRVLDRVVLSAREMLSLLGVLGAAADLVALGRLFMRPLQTYLLYYWTPHVQSLDMTLPLSAYFKRHLRWWARESRFLQGIPLTQSPPSVFLTTDASNQGWGALLDPQGSMFSGIWTQDVALEHINCLEMRAIQKGLESSLKVIQNRTVLVLSDSVSAVAYLNKQGGTRSIALCLLAREILLWCQEFHVILTARHLPGKNNVLADCLSRQGGPVPNEWALDQWVCNAFISRWGSPWVDLFATRLNNRLPLYVSPAPDLHAWRLDALTFLWSRLDGYAFPPFALIPRILAKVKDDQALLTLVAPLWPSRSWFPRLLLLLVDQPILLPLRGDLLTQHSGKIRHLAVGRLNLHAWRLSGRTSDARDFRTRLPRSSQHVVDFHYSSLRC